MQGSQNFKIPGSPSGRYSSDFGSPKINLTSPKKKDHIYIYKKIRQEFKSIKNILNTQISTNMKEGILFHYLQGIYRIFLNKFKAIYDPF